MQPDANVIGTRLRAAREVAGLGQTETAKRLGHAQSVHLCEWERGKRLPPLVALMRLAQMYGTTVDYLLGLSDEIVPDPVAAVQAAVAARISFEVEHLARTMADQTATLVRAFMPSAARGERLAGLALEAQDALQRLRERCPAFDKDLPASALVARLQLAADAAAEYRDDARRAREAQRVRDQHAALRVLVAPINLPAFEAA